MMDVTTPLFRRQKVCFRWLELVHMVVTVGLLVTSGTLFHSLLERQADVATLQVQVHQINEMMGRFHHQIRVLRTVKHEVAEMLLNVSRAHEQVTHIADTLLQRVAAEQQAIQKQLEIVGASMATDMQVMEQRVRAVQTNLDSLDIMAIVRQHSRWVWIESVGNPGALASLDTTRTFCFINRSGMLGSGPTTPYCTLTQENGQWRVSNDYCLVACLEFV
jgi:hypothetical protein